MNIVVYANCQGIGIKTFIHALTRFHKSVKVRHFENYRMINGEAPIEPLLEAAGGADYFIYQPLGASQGRFSTEGDAENVISSVRDGCQLISFPYVYNNGLWPLFHESTLQNLRPILRILEDGGSAEDALNVTAHPLWAMG